MLTSRCWLAVDHRSPPWPEGLVSIVTETHSDSTEDRESEAVAVDRSPATFDATVASLYRDLHRLANHYVRRDRRGLTLSATELVHEVYQRLARDQPLRWEDENHFMAMVATAMRRLLIDHARHRARLKRGGGWQRVTLGPLANSPQILDGAELLALDAALNRLAEMDPRQAQVVEMRFFAGMRLVDVAAALGVTRRTVDRDWAHAKVWLARELDPQ